MPTPSAKKKARPQQPFEALRSLSPFSLFSDDELRELIPLCEIQELVSGAEILKEGDPSDNRVYFLLDGEVSVYVGGNFILSLKRTGDIFGEMSLISDEPRSATVKTDTPVTLLAINSALTFDPGEQRYYKFRYYFSRMFNAILADKLRITSERARMYEDAVQKTRQAAERSTSLQEQVRQNLDQIRLYSHLVESAKDAILIVNTSGLVLEANPSLETEFGAPREELLGVPIEKLIALPVSGPDSWEEIQAAAKAGGWSGEVRVSGRGRAKQPADCSVSLVQDANQEALAYSVILRNTRQRKAYERQILKQSRELKKANTELRELDRLKDNFMNLVSHELRTPLTSIIAYAETLSIEGMVEPEERGEFLAIIHKEALRLNELVNKVLTISKIESGQMLFDFREGQLDDLARMAVANLRSKAKSKGLTLEFEQKTAIAQTCFDSDRIREVLQQLLANALENTDAGSIRVVISQNGKETLIEVVDTGKGMDGKLVTGAFSKFDWVDNIQYHQSGIGLGLPLCFLIANAHSGSIRLQSEVGSGTTVSVTLPHQPEQAADPS
jgi:PAS domain S-box-containing protein